MMKFWIVLISAAVLAFSEPCVGVDTVRVVDADTVQLISAEAAFGKVFDYTGFAEVKAIPAISLAEIASLAVVETCDIPFLADSVVGHQVWKVKLDSIYIDSPRWLKKQVAKHNPKSFEAWIDAETGQLIQIFSRFNGYDPDLAPEPPADSAARQMRQTGEVFLGFPAETPSITFFEALGAAAGSNPLKAKEIIAVCVIRQYMDRDPQPVWSIIGRGIPPVEIHKIEGPMYQRNRMRTVVSATTGEMMTITNRPSVLRREEDR